MKKKIWFLIVFCAVFFFALLLKEILKTESNNLFPSTTTPTTTPPPILAIPPHKILKNDYHIYQTFNNCGPAALSMALSYYSIQESQESLGSALRPYQNPQGNNDDKSVTLEELANKAKEYNLIPYHRPNGDIETIKLFIAQDIPVITRTWLKTNDDIGHFRIIKGYDEEKKELIQDDSLQGKNLEYSFEDFNILWGKFNYEYLVLVPKEKQNVSEKILGENKDVKKAWKNSILNIQNDLKNNPQDIYSHFNLSVAYYHVENYKNSVIEFEKVETKLPKRTLWYQTEPIQAYYELDNYTKVFSLTDEILNNNNRAFSELYIIRGKIYQKQGNLNLAKSEFQKAVFYNKNLKEAQKALSNSI